MTTGILQNKLIFNQEESQRGVKEKQVKRTLLG